jgi:hypothetical protein
MSDRGGFRGVEFSDLRFFQEPKIKKTRAERNERKAIEPRISVIS